MNKEQLDQYIGRCQKNWFDEIDEEAPYEWKAFGSVTFEYVLGFSQSRRLFYRWLAQIDKTISPRMFNWFAVIEFDRWNNRVRIYVLLGGSGFSLQPRWKLRWRELSGGEATIFDYRRGAFSKYVLAEAQVGHYFQVAMDLCSWGRMEFDRD